MINWSTRSYVNTLNTLLTAQIDGIRVEGMRPQRQPSALQPLALIEVEIERFEGQSAGAIGVLDGELFAAMVVIRKCDTIEAEAELLDLTLEVATVLQDLREQGAIGPAQVVAIEPEPLNEAIGKRVSAWRISYAQQLRLQRVNGGEDTVPYARLFAGRVPYVGPEHKDEYERLVPRP
jgi:hypothetical protein